MSLGTRLKELREKRGLTQNEVGHHIDKSKQMISLYESDTNVPPLKILSSLAELYKVPLDEIMKEEETTTDESSKISHTTQNRASSQPRPYWNQDGEGVPYYDVDVFAGDIIAINDMNFKPVSYIQLPGTSDCDFGCRVSGNSMVSKIYPGAIILCKEIRNKDIIAYGEVHFVATAEQRFVKIIRRHPDKSDCIILRSLNPEYDDIEIKRQDMDRLFLVKVIVNQEQM